MRRLSSAMFFMSIALSAPAALVTKTIEYRDGDTTLKGYLAYDDKLTANAPGVVVFPEWWGLTDYPKKRAEQLAALGYVAFAADMYGDGKTTQNPKDAGEWAGAVKKSQQQERELIQAAIDTLKKQPQVDPDKLGA